MAKYTNSEKFLGEKLLITIDRPIGSEHPRYPNLIYKVNYGFVPDTLSPDGEELDAYLLGVDKPVSSYEGVCIAVLKRVEEDDDKLIIVPPGEEYTEDEIRTELDFQEQYFESKIIFG